LIEALYPNPLSSTCETIVSIRTWSYFGSLFIAELLLVLRTIAIWDRSKRIGCSLLAFMIICFSGIGYISKRFIESLGFGIRTSPNTATLSGCIFTSGSLSLDLLPYSHIIRNGNFHLNHIQGNSTTTMETLPPFQGGLSPRDCYLCLCLPGIDNQHSCS